MTELILGIEGGGTKTTWSVVELDETTERVLSKGQIGSGNVQLLEPEEFREKIREIHRACPHSDQISAICGAFAGCQLPEEKRFVEGILQECWPQARVVRAVEDSQSALGAAFGGKASGIIVIAGTGSNVVGCGKPGGKLEKVVGWGQLVGDRGSSYDLAKSGLEIVYEEYDSTQEVSILGEEYLRLCEKPDLEQLVPLLLRDAPSKTLVASRAPAVFAAAARGHAGARELISERADFLAERVKVIAGRIGLDSPGVALTGGLFENQPSYFQDFKDALSLYLPGARPFILQTPGTIGAARLVAKAHPPLELISTEPATSNKPALSLTEHRNSRSQGLDKKSIPDLVELFIEEELWVTHALKQQKSQLADAASLVSQTLCKGGRLFYIGAGTSGRLGVVDASEMPPTFNASPEEIQAIIAGGPEAVFKSQEGAEDSTTAAEVELKKRALQAGDVVCGIAASGQTPFVIGGLSYAKSIGAKTILLSCNPYRKQLVQVDVAIDLATGPELITGSTRLKAGTATKLVLNVLSSIAMIRLGRVQDNLMVNVQATNEKLRGRAIRLVMTLTNCDEAAAQASLESHAWRVPKAVEAIKGA